MSENNLTTTLDSKITQLIEKYKALQSDNEKLRNELMQSKAKCEAQAYEISKLEDELLEKNIKDEETIKKIEQVINLGN